ncbi:MAG: GDP-mannose 4,6-dehydratase, partial [Anaerolineae bacterium]|nr:GDP-mannose 4,6-dehydratase [Anaerolineae bacterium]
MRILVTGAAGFAGQHLMRYLHHIQPQAELHGTVYRTAAPAGLPGIFTRVDLCQAEAVLHLLQRLQPDCIYHLAGQAAPAQAFKQPWHTLETNIRSQFNLLEGCREIGLQPRFLCVTSAEVYGVVQPQELPLREDAPLRPASPYGLSKITQDLMGWQYFLSYSLP